MKQFCFQQGFSGSSYSGGGAGAHLLSKGGGAASSSSSGGAGDSSPQPAMKFNPAGGLPYEMHRLGRVLIQNQVQFRMM
jgi:hypothetical protein